MSGTPGCSPRNRAGRDSSRRWAGRHLRPSRNRRSGLPPSARPDVVPGPSALAALAEHGTGWWLTARWLFLLTSLLGLGLVVGLRRLAPPGRGALADWAAAVGGLGFAGVALDQTRLIAHVPGLVEALAASPDRAREISNLSLVNLTDRYGLLTFGALTLAPLFFGGLAVLVRQPPRRGSPRPRQWR